MLTASKSLEDSVKFIPALQKEMEKKEEGSRRLMIAQRQGVATSAYVCQGHLREEKWDKLCEIKEEIRKGCWK